MSNPSEDLNREFVQFLEAKESSPAQSSQDAVKNRVYVDLNPHPVAVLLKLIGILVLSAPISIYLCPQFGWGFTPGDPGLMGYFMQFGPYGCMSACGALFVGSCMFLSALVLRPEEIRTVRAHRLLQVMVVSLFALGGFLCLGADVFGSVAWIWILGATIGGMTTLELGWVIRQRTITYRSL